MYIKKGAPAVWILQSSLEWTSLGMHETMGVGGGQRAVAGFVSGLGFAFYALRSDGARATKCRFAVLISPLQHIQLSID